MLARITLLILLVCSSGLIRGETLIHRGTNYFVYRVDRETDDLQLLLAQKPGKPNTFSEVQRRLEKNGQRLKFAMNAGIFEGTFYATGLHVSEGKVITPLNLADYKKERESEFTPNFYLKPNGVFFVRPDKSASVLESKRFSQANETVELATQSGPLLVEEGRIHPILSPTSESKRIRNGVGVDREGNVIFASSIWDPVKGITNLYHFAEFFRDRLNCPNTLYLDGDISYIYIRGETKPIQDTNWFAGILAITEPVP